VRLADELHDSGRVSDGLWPELDAHWSAGELVEAVCLAGFYHLVSYVCGAFAVEPEPWAVTPPG
jgi:4-carboxymuconolactone decarboxylase